MDDLQPPECPNEPDTPENIYPSPLGEKVARQGRMRGREVRDLTTPLTLPTASAAGPFPLPGGAREKSAYACGTPLAAATSAAKSDCSFSMPSPSWKRT